MNYNNWLIKISKWPGGGLLEDDYFNRIREKLKIQDEYSLKDDDSQLPKKNVGSTTEFGSNDRGHNPGAGVGLGRDENESKDKSLSSGYNDGGQPNDEIGPGNSNTIPDPYHAATMNEVFLDIKIKGDNKDNRPSNYLQKLLDGPGIPKPHKRYAV